jgi:DNA-binding CsgD family transcriptional regulator
VLQACLDAAVKAQPRRGSSAGEVMSVMRPSGRRPFPLMVGPLLAAHPDSSIDDAKALLFIADPEGGHISTSEVLETLYQLTPAEAELVRLIAEGRSLEEVAAERGVTMNTVRSQLKQVFSKTETSRQGELVHLVLTGVASIRSGHAS